MARCGGVKAMRDGGIEWLMFSDEALCALFLNNGVGGTGEWV